jgi:hypothetical protein
MVSKAHWESVYGSKAPEAVSWYRAHLERSLALIERSCPDRSASIIDDVVRYDTGSLHEQFGAGFRLLDSATELHQTPFGTTQQFLYCMCRVARGEAT